MFAWLVDHAGLAYLLLGSAALMLGSAWWLNRRRPYLIGLAVVAALLLFLFLLTRFLVTDRQQIERGLQEMAQGVLDEKPKQVFRHLSKQFSFSRVDRTTFEPRAEKTIRQRQIQDLYLWKFEFEELDRAARKARVAFNVRVTSAWTEGTQVFLVRADFVLEDGQWRMRTFQLYNPVVNTDQPLQIPLP
jgi:hypothetical protein